MRSQTRSYQQPFCEQAHSSCQYSATELPRLLDHTLPANGVLSAVVCGSRIVSDGLCCLTSTAIECSIAIASALPQLHCIARPLAKRFTEGQFLVERYTAQTCKFA